MDWVEPRTIYPPRVEGVENIKGPLVMIEASTSYSYKHFIA